MEKSMTPYFYFLENNEWPLGVWWAFFQAISKEQFQAFTPQMHFELEFQVQVEGQLLKGYKDDIICGSMGKLLL